MRLGEALLKAGLITPVQLEQALLIQQSTRERLGGLLKDMCLLTQEQIDHAWLDVVVRPALEAAIDRACFNAFGRRNDRSLRFTQARRRIALVEDLLFGGVESEREVGIEGVAVIELPGQGTLELRFTHDPMLSFAQLQDDDDERIREWLGTGGASRGAAEKAAAMIRGERAACAQIGR